MVRGRFLYILPVFSFLPLLFASLCAAIPPRSDDVNRINIIERYIVDHCRKGIYEQIHSLGEYFQMVAGTHLEANPFDVMQNAFEHRINIFPVTREASWDIPETIAELKRWQSIFIDRPSYHINEDAYNIVSQTIVSPVAVILTRAQASDGLSVQFIYDQTYFESIALVGNADRSERITADAIQVLRAYEIFDIVPNPAFIYLSVDANDLPRPSITVLAHPESMFFGGFSSKTDACNLYVRFIASEIMKVIDPDQCDHPGDVSSTIHSYFRFYEHTYPEHITRQFHEILLMMGGSADGYSDTCIMKEHPYFTGSLDNIDQSSVSSSNVVHATYKYWYDERRMSWAAGINDIKRRTTIDLHSGSVIYVRNLPMAGSDSTAGYGLVHGSPDGFEQVPTLAKPIYTAVSPKREVTTAYLLPDGHYKDAINIRQMIQDRDGFTINHFVKIIDDAIAIMSKTNMPDEVPFDFSPFTNNVLVIGNEDRTIPPKLVFLMDYAFSKKVHNRHCSVNSGETREKVLGACIADLYLEMRGYTNSCPFMKYEMETSAELRKDATETKEFEMLMDIVSDIELQFVSELYRTGIPSDLGSIAKKFFSDENMDQLLENYNNGDDEEETLDLSCSTYSEILTGLKRGGLSSNTYSGISFVQDSRHAAHLLRVLLESEEFEIVELTVIFGSIIAIYTERLELYPVFKSQSFLTSQYSLFRYREDMGIQTMLTEGHSVLAGHVASFESFILTMFDAEQRSRYAANTDIPGKFLSLIWYKPYQDRPLHGVQDNQKRIIPHLNVMSLANIVLHRLDSDQSILARTINMRRFTSEHFYLAIRRELLDLTRADLRGITFDFITQRQTPLHRELLGIVH